MPLHYTLVNIKDWCKNEFEVINQLRINTSNSHHRYDVILLINGIPIVQIELKSLEVSPRKAVQQFVDYKSDQRKKTDGNATLADYCLKILAKSLRHTGIEKKEFVTPVGCQWLKWLKMISI